ncbi:hypothetical protein DAEQUDRAFT_730640 [Daedalea quercina L-15889]|uniref:Uncharacterized protein n=1 Tax=Daedalea quercina L-15889 TaxID=1314783 RepID=A0A165MUE5_9APHY|nr:hypothetical protein DAEQUDRAFT_730640 [Daedalea quercina L-15889]
MRLLYVTAVLARFAHVRWRPTHLAAREQLTDFAIRPFLLTMMEPHLSSDTAQLVSWPIEPYLRTLLANLQLQQRIVVGVYALLSCTTRMTSVR